MKGLFPGATRRLSFVQVWLQDGSEVGVEGYGLPFSNPSHPSEGWLNRLEPIVGDKTLVDIIDQRHFTFVVHKPCDVLRRDWHENEMPPPFCYPYGTVHDWDLERFDSLICSNQGYQFWPSWSFDDQNAHTAALVHSQVQDIRWLCHAAEQIVQQRFLACFVTTKDGENVGDKTPSSFAIVSLTSEFLNRYDTPWRHLIRDGFLKLELYNNPEDGRHTSVCDAKIVDRPTKIDAVRSAHATKNELVLQIRRRYTAANELEFRMSLQRALVLGSGFWSVLRRFKAAPASSRKASEGLEASTAKLSLDESVPVTLPCVPEVNLLDIRDPAMLDALMAEVLPTDRPRFRQYFSKRALGIGLMTAVETLGPIFASAPTNVAVNTFATRLYAVSSGVVDRYNKGKREKNRIRRKLVIRGHNEEEHEAFQRLLQHPDGAGDAGSRLWKKPGAWSLHLSKAYWLLACLRSPAVSDLHPNDSFALHRLRRDLDADHKFARLRSVASGAISWEDYISGRMAADIVCGTPAQSCGKLYHDWKNTKAKGFAIDEAASMTRPDLYSVWGNTMMPCILAGDEKQLPPAVMTLDEKDSQGNAINRLGREARISPLEFFMGLGMPVYR
ncbi:uncharacterized protein NECHADRAFT_49645, partial [Fusarium vanettenii 77-13-4]